MQRWMEMHLVVLRDPAATERLGRAVARGATRLVDILIAVYALALVIAAFGGVDLGIVTLTNPAKPILILAILVPVRLALPGDPWFLRSARTLAHWTQRKCGALGTRVRIAPAVQDVAFAIVVTRTFSFVVAFLANVLLSPARPRRLTMPFESEKFAEIFAAWDSGWYFDIARRGYYFRADGESSIAFFPLYPTLMSLLAWPFGSTERALLAAGIFISLVSFALALVALHNLTFKLVGDRQAARRAVLYVAVFPFSLFFTRVYAESLFLLTSLLAISRAFDGRWWSAGAWGAAATLARPNGILVAIPLALLALREWPGRPALLGRVTALLTIPAAFAGYCAYVYTLSGDPFAWFTAQAHWGYSLGHPPWQQLLKMIDRFVDYGLYGYFFVTPMAPYRLLHGAVALIFLALVPGIVRRFGVALGAYVLISLLVPLSSDALEGIGRYAMVLFPAFMLVATFKSQTLHETIVIGSALMLALLNCLFVTLHPIY